MRGKTVNVLSIRCKNAKSVEDSLVFSIRLSEQGLDSENIKWIGWEKNDQGKLIPRIAKMAASMDPERLN